MNNWYIIPSGFCLHTNFALTSKAIEGIYTKAITRTYTDTGAKGRILGMSIGTAGNYSYAYDAYGRLNTLTTSAGNFTYAPLANSNLPGTVTRPNNVNTTWSYETNRDLVTAVANGNLSTYSYVNDVLGRRQSMAKSGSLFNPTETLSYAYNDRSEVTGASSDVNPNFRYK
ncbi:MAG: hypothetical protein BWY31_03774 [Lentisphaerae bacterium ADurb.Bin242]|nr:MAG: hypothetical protein BWY31_03774 [Lentisphaerae bacterium ADurb.Bin242]